MLLPSPVPSCPTTMDQLDDQALAHVAQYFQVLAEPTRLKVLNALRTQERNVGELAELLGFTTANVSKHLSLLAKNGFVEKESRGTASYFRIADPAIFELCNLVCGNIGKRMSAHSAMAAQFLPPVTAPKRKPR